MKITVPQPDLLALLSAVSRGVSGRSTQPVQNNILVSATADGALRLAATDLEYIGVEAFAQVEVLEPGALCAPTLLAELVGKLAEGPVNLELLSPQELLVSGGAAKVKLRCLPPDDHQFLPELQEPAEFVVSAGALREGLSRTLFSCGRDETRPLLTGILLVASPESDKLTLVSTDAYRLTETVIPLAGAPANACKVIAHAKLLGEVQRSLGYGTEDEVTLRLSSRLAQIASGQLRFSSRLIEGEYPNYQDIFSADFARAVSVEVAPLREAIQRALLVARESPHRMTLHLEEDSLEITSCGDMGETTAESLPAALTGEPLACAFNGSMLLQGLGAASAEQVRMRFSGALNPVMMETGDGWRHVMMPLQEV